MGKYPELRTTLFIKVIVQSLYREKDWIKEYKQDESNSLMTLRKKKKKLMRKTKTKDKNRLLHRWFSD